MAKNLALSTAKQRIRRYEAQLAAKTQQIDEVRRVVLLSRANAEQAKNRAVINICDQIERVLYGSSTVVRSPESPSILSNFRRWLGFGDARPVAVLERDLPELSVPERVLLSKNGVPEAGNGVLLGERNVPDVPEHVLLVPKNVPERRTFASERTKSASMRVFERNCVSAIVGYMNEVGIAGYVAGATIAPQAILFKIDLQKSSQRRQFKSDDLALWLGVDDNEVSITNRLGQLVCVIALPSELKRDVFASDLPSDSIGLDMDNQPLSLPFSASNNALFIVGQQGCGKSTLIETIMHSVIASHQGQCQILIVDHRDEIDAFDGIDALIQPRVSDPHQVNDVLAAFVDTAPKRGKDADPVFLFIDEVMELISKYDLDVKWLTLIANLRRYNVFVIAATQDLDSDVYSFSKFATMRIAGNVADAAISGRVLGAGINAHLLQPPADFILSFGGKKTRFKGAMPDKQLIARLPKSEPQNTANPAPERKIKNTEPNKSAIDIEAEMNMTGRTAPDFYIPVYLAAELAFLNGETDQRSLAQAAKHFGIGKDKARMHRDFARRIQVTYKKILEAES